VNYKPRERAAEGQKTHDGSVEIDHPVGPTEKSIRQSNWGMTGCGGCPTNDSGQSNATNTLVEDCHEKALGGLEMKKG